MLILYLFLHYTFKIVLPFLQSNKNVKHENKIAERGFQNIKCLRFKISYIWEKQLYFSSVFSFLKPTQKLSKCLRHNKIVFLQRHLAHCLETRHIEHWSLNCGLTRYLINYLQQLHTIFVANHEREIQIDLDKFQISTHTFEISIFWIENMSTKKKEKLETCTKVKTVQQ